MELFYMIDGAAAARTTSAFSLLTVLRLVQDCIMCNGLLLFQTHTYRFIPNEPEIMTFFGQEFMNWCMCLIAENTNTNLRVARLAKKPHVGCNSHKLNLELSMLRRFEDIRDQLVDASNDPNCNIPIDTSMLFPIRQVMKEERRNPPSKLFGCNLGTKYIASCSNIVPNSSFESGVVKIQSSEVDKLTDVEKESASILRKRKEPDLSVPETQQSFSIAERLSKRRKIDTSKEEYMDTSFILGSVAEVERL
eukprot:IDg7217t1